MTAIATLIRRSTSGDLAVSSQRPMATPASRNPDHGNSVNVPRPGIGRMYHSIGSGSGDISGVARTMGVTIATATVAATIHATRSHRVRPALQSSAAASIDRPMMFRMSTFSIACTGSPPLISHDCSRKRNARPKICSARRRAIAAVSVAEFPRRSREPAASASAMPARKRKAGAAKPATIIAQPYVLLWRASRRVHASSVWASIMMRTETPRSQSRYPRLPAPATGVME